MYGLLLEASDNRADAIASFKRAEELLVDPKLINMVKENRARCHANNGEYIDAIAAYEEIIRDESYDALTFVGYALTLFFAEKLEPSLMAFQKALDLTQDDKTRNQVTLYLSQLLFALGAPEHLELAKQQLLEW